MQKLTIITVALLKLSVACSPAATYTATPPNFQQWQPSAEHGPTATLVVSDSPNVRHTQRPAPIAYPGIMPAEQGCENFTTHDAQLVARCDRIAYNTCGAMGARLGLAVHENPLGADGFECVLDAPQGGDCWDVGPGAYSWRGYCVAPVAWGDVAN